MAKRTPPLNHIDSSGKLGPTEKAILKGIGVKVPPGGRAPEGGAYPLPKRHGPAPARSPGSKPSGRRK